MSYNDINVFKQYYISCTMDWYDVPVTLFRFEYTLSQYTPSIYAKVTFTLPNKEFQKFKKIDTLELIDRKLEVEFMPELYRLSGEKSYFPGPYKLIAINYQVIDIPNHLQIEPNDNKEMDISKAIVLECVDKVFYSMTIEKKYKSYPSMLTSDVAKKIIVENGGTPKLVTTTDYKYTWLQPQLTDYKMIRSILPYSQTPDEKTLYTFFSLNNECYYTYVGSGKTEKLTISIDNISGYENINNSDDLKLLIEKFGMKDIKIAHHGFSNFNTYEPINISLLAGESNKAEWKQHQSQGTMYLTNVIEDKKLLTIFISNLRHRIHTFSRSLTLNMHAIPDLLPIDTIEISHVVGGEDKPLGGLYYIASIKYIYPGKSGVSAMYHVTPTMELFLISELDSYSNKGKEGDTIQ